MWRVLMRTSLEEVCEGKHQQVALMDHQHRGGLDSWDRYSSRLMD